MKYLHLIWAALFRRKARAVLTLLSIAAAFLLFGLLDSVRNTFAQAGQGAHGANRLYTISKVDGAELPLSLYSAIQSLPGVTKVMYGSSLGGTYQDAKNFVGVEAQGENVFDLYPEASAPLADLQAYRTTRTGALVRADFAEKYHWKRGDKISFQTHVEQRNGSPVWTFDVVGIYDLPEPKEVLPPVMFHWDYLDEGRALGKGMVGWYNTVVADLNQADTVAHAIDALSANSAHETKTQSENAFFANFVRQFANIGLIVGSIMGAVFFTLTLLTGNVMAQAVRERVSEMAVLKTLGFTSRTVLALILGESVLLLLLGAAIGLALAAISVPLARAQYGEVLPMPVVAGNIWSAGLALATLMGLAVGAIPARRGLRLKIVDALSGR